MWTCQGNDEYSQCYKNNIETESHSQSPQQTGCSQKQHTHPQVYVTSLSHIWGSWLGRPPVGWAGCLASERLGKHNNLNFLRSNRKSYLSIQPLMMAQTILLVILLSQFEVVCVKAAKGRYTNKSVKATFLCVCEWISSKTSQTHSSFSNGYDSGDWKYFKHMLLHVNQSWSGLIQCCCTDDIEMTQNYYIGES